MSEKLKTIKELADEIGVSKQAVWQKIKKESSIDLRQFTSKKGNTVYVDVDGQKVIKSAFFNKTSTKKRQQKFFVDDNVNDSVDGNPEGNEEILFLRNLVSELQSEKKDLHKLLDQQQRLALQDKKVLEDYKSEINELKALKMPSQETEFKHLDNQYKDEVNALKEKLENLQEQIKDQKRIEEQEKPRKWWGLWRK
ncbi:integrating conjugative element protein, PFL 4705 family [Lactococcus cremoris]|uniref:RepB-like protein n=4 Tax=Lactococcus TaxID=1357 RepID=A0A1E7G025_LACLC|nr:MULTISPECIES: RepB-like protein [Lactococcus]KKW69481.1 integrating conjugative element protein, PFL 4705 family [Lactococcus cremoris]KKW69845.1 integrating conjugative element protein, PFL 4705 family [Lactococcus cremoris]KWT46394.1 RepB-like protein [Lactococcus lactis]MBR8675368.1 RepB-like protein [Lactococcus lactis subsp. lactis]MBR8678144.1 RepB-like protein [Lactococcus lactis subsp. lactis]